MQRSLKSLIQITGMISLPQDSPLAGQTQNLNLHTLVSLAPLQGLIARNGLPLTVPLDLQSQGINTPTDEVIRHSLRSLSRKPVTELVRRLTVCVPTNLNNNIFIVL